jgi:hypothetical protein
MVTPAVVVHVGVVVVEVCAALTLNIESSAKRRTANLVVVNFI